MMTRGKKQNQQLKMELVMLDQLVKADHDLRRIDKYIDFDFIYDLVEPYYANDKGRPSIDPIVFGNRKLQLLAIKNTIASTNLDHFINEFVMR
jgi:transposase